MKALLSSRGFTIVELVVTIAVIGILVVIGTLGFRTTQQDVRDQERAGDVTALMSELEKAYDTNGEYPPGCPKTSCTSWFSTENTSTAPILSSTTITSLKTILPGITDDFADPSFKSGSLFANDAVAENRYFYTGGMVNNRTYGSSLSYSTPSPQACTVAVTLSPNEVSSYVVGYYSESASQGVLQGGRSGKPFYISAGTAANGCVIN